MSKHKVFHKASWWEITYPVGILVVGHCLLVVIVVVALANLVDRVVLLLKRERITQSGDAARDDSLVSSGLGHDENAAELFLALRDSDSGQLQVILVVEAPNLTVLPVWEAFLNVNSR